MKIAGYLEQRKKSVVARRKAGNAISKNKKVTQRKIEQSLDRIFGLNSAKKSIDSLYEIEYGKGK